MTDQPTAQWPPRSAEPPAEPGFPREEFTALVRRLPAYARLAWALAKDPRLSKARRAAVLAGAAYVISPIDFVPGVIPVLGQLDDLAVALAVIRVALDGLKPDVRAAKLADAGMSEADLAADIRATRDMLVWLGRSTVRAGKRLVAVAVDAGARAGARAGERLPEARDRLRDAGRALRMRVTRG
ncbi:hypothetical protein BH23CHL7_BH23CHL7_07300 [soil metagenome]